MQRTVVEVARALLLVSTIAIAATYAHATPIVVDFDDLSVGSYYMNVTSNGFRLSPSCHIDVFQKGGQTSNSIGWDRSGCLDGGSNPDYLGHAPTNRAAIYVDSFGQPFDFVRLSITPDYFSEGFSLTSSKGGMLALGSPVAGDIAMSGSDWIGILWMELTYGDPGEPVAQLDSLTFKRVPEPGTIWLVGAAGFALLVLRTRRLRSAPRTQGHQDREA